jgi:hypothetical protein
MKLSIIYISIFFIPVCAWAQGGYSYPGNYIFKPFADSQKAYNYSGFEFFMGRNISPTTDRNFVFLKNSINNWGFVKLSQKTSLYSQIQRSDEVFFKDNGLTKSILNSVTEGFYWNPDTIINLTGARVGLVGYQDFGCWIERTRESKSYLIGLRLRDYSNIYVAQIDTGYFANRFTSTLNTGSEYIAHAQIDQFYLSGNTATFDVLQNGASNLFSEFFLPKNFLILLDYTERHKINNKHDFELSLIGIPIINRISDILYRKMGVDWNFSGVNLSQLDSIVPQAILMRDTNIRSVSSTFNSSNNSFKPSQEIHLGWNYTPLKALRCSAKFSYYSNHLFDNSNLAFGLFQNHGSNLQIMMRTNFSSQFGNWNEIGILFKPLPKITVFGNVSGGDILRFREETQVKKNFKVLNLTFGLFANL